MNTGTTEVKLNNIDKMTGEQHSKKHVDELSTDPFFKWQWELDWFIRDVKKYIENPNDWIEKQDEEGTWLGYGGGLYWIKKNTVDYIKEKYIDK